MNDYSVTVTRCCSYSCLCAGLACTCNKTFKLLYTVIYPDHSGEKKCMTEKELSVI